MITRSQAGKSSMHDIATTSKCISPHPCDHLSQVSTSINSHASTTSSATIKARKAAAEAHAKRRQLERERQLFELEKQVEESELRAELATIEAKGSSRRRSSHRGSERSQQSCRTQAWVEDAVSNVPFLFQNTQEVTVLSDREPSHKDIDFHKPNIHCSTQATNRSEAVARTLPHPHIDIGLSGSGIGSGKILQAVADTAAAAKALATAQNNNIKRTIDLMQFSGETTKWLQFKRLFETTKALFSPLENVARLQQALRGAAREAVAALLVSAQDPDEIIGVLEQNFARPEMIVFQEVAALKALPRLGNDLRDIGTFATKVRNSLSTIRMLDYVEYLYSPELYHTILGKLNPVVKMRWTDFAVDNCTPNQPKLELLSSFLMREFDKHVRFGLSPEYASFIVASNSSQDRQSKREYVHAVTQYKNKSVISSVNNNSSNSEVNTAPFNSVNSKSCPFCKKLHSIKMCSDFKALTVEDRWRWQHEAKACYRCLRCKPHKWKTCKVNVCGIDGCTLRHHPLLHGSQWPNQTSVAVNNIANDVSPVLTHSPHDNQVVISTTSTDTVSPRDLQQASPAALLKVVPVTVYGPSGSYDTYALLDDGSTATLIDASVAAQIGVSGPRQQISVNGVGGLTKNVEIAYVDFKIKGKYTQDIFDIKRARSFPSLLLHTQTVKRQSISGYSHLKDLTDFLIYENAKPMVLIGTEHWHLSINHSVRKGKRSEPVACLTALGWTLYGLPSSTTKHVHFVNHTAFIDQELTSKNDNLDFLIKEHYKLESLGISKHETIHSKLDKRAIEILEATTSRLPTGRFEVGLPWRDNIKHIPDSYPQALSRLLSLERRMRREPEFAVAYRKFMNNMVDKGYAEVCPSNTYYNKNTQFNLKNIRLYLPHFGIYHPQKRKLRVVHDAAAMNEGVSLNSLLLQGPDLLQNLLHILFRFREGRVALTADIKEMFPQIRVRHEDRDALRFLWRDGDQRQVIKEYRMTSVIFGASSSPFTALYIKNKNAEEHEQCLPNAAKAIIENHYMDDYLGSHDSSEVAAEIARDIVAVHNAACFEMREWVSNDDTALRLIPAELCAEKPSEVNLGSSPTVVRALGIVWDPNSDTLGFRTGLGETFPAQLTKRKVLSHLMRVYDPLGLLGPVVIKGRILFQNNWRSNIDWDSELSPTETSKWLEWFNELLTVSTFKIPRWYSKAFDVEPLQRELHIFCDASESAYACVAYWRLLYADKSVKLAIIGSKARVAPLKPISIPRLELMAALIASRLAVTIKDSHVKKPSRTFFWTDSTTVLSWLRSDARSFKPFVAHRIGEITENSSISDWKWVPTGMNVADDATRLHSAQLDKSSRWFTGPTFLLLPSEDWPKEPVSEVPSVQSQVELKSLPIEMVGALTEHIGKTRAVTADCSRFSSWLRLVRATARVHQAAFIFRQLIQNSRFSGHRPQSLNTSTVTSLIPLTAEFMNAAERHILWKIQLDSFLEDITCILNSKPLPRTSRLAKLSPMIGDDKLLRLGGRIRAADVDQSVKTPVLLDGGSHPVARLLVYRFHVMMGHANHETVINELRQHYWILRLRSTVRTVAHRCLFCKIRKSLPQAPPTGNLPQERMAHHKRCFTFTGLDYFGPVSVTIGRRREKRYVALFTCLTSRAVHLELAHTLSADSAISCIRRFIARRGAPDTIFSDNGTAFVGANKILREFYSNGVEDFAANNGVKWHFIPPAAPNFGGCWERLVRSIKVALNATLKSRSPKEETLLTLLSEAEAVVNSRPLTHVSVHADDQETLTPFHFLIGSSSIAALPATLTDNVLVGRTEWKKALRLSDFFWSRWVKEVLPTMQPRQRPYRSLASQIACGDLVLIADSNLPRGVWPRGRITATYPGRDNVVRVVDVSTAAGTLRRPLSKLVKLNVN